MDLSRRDFIRAIGGLAATAALAEGADCDPSASASACRSEELQSELITKWNCETESVSPQVYRRYMLDGDTRGFRALDALERAFEKVMREANGTVVAGDVPAVWSVYNMGYIVKTRKSLFSIDLVHRRDAEFAPLLDFALITHNHSDHWRQGFYDTMNGAHKTVVSNFKDNYGVQNWKKDGGYIRGVKTFRIKDVEIRTSLIDHNDYLIDFTTAFEIKTGNFIIYHTGDCGVANDKLCVTWGRPDLWLMFPMSSLDIADAVRRIGPKRVAFGHLWELGHAVGKGRAHKWHIDRAMPKAKARCEDVSVAFWGDRIV